MVVGVGAGLFALDCVGLGVGETKGPERLKLRVLGLFALDWAGLAVGETKGPERLKLRVLERTLSNFSHDLTRSESLPNVDTTWIFGVPVLLSDAVGLSALRLRDLSIPSTFVAILSIIEVG